MDQGKEKSTCVKSTYKRLRDMIGFSGSSAREETCRKRVESPSSSSSGVLDDNLWIRKAGDRCNSVLGCSSPALAGKWTCGMNSSLASRWGQGWD